MHRLIINQLGPIEHCELECKDFLTLTGFQASGKSTIAKTIYFFRTIKDDVISLAIKQALDSLYDAQKKDLTLRRALEAFLREKFLRIFGSSWGMQNDMYIQYFYAEGVSVKVNLKEETLYPTPNYIWIDLSPKITKFLSTYNKHFSASLIGIPEENKKEFQDKVFRLFNDEYPIVYIPAGRSMITLLSSQLSYLYSTMEDSQKRTLDYCTQDYLERILRLKPEFELGLRGILSDERKKDYIIKEKALQLINKVLRGTYQYTNGEERILVDEKKYVKINFSSSGQQESVWILNLLFYYLAKKNPVLFIIEEPESHLFPESQKYITELISLIYNQGFPIVITTHSPYILGTLNNLLYAEHVAKSAPQNHSKIDKIVSEDFWLQPSRFSTWFVKEGGVENCMDSETIFIENEKIDEISLNINKEFDDIFNVTFEES